MQRTRVRIRSILVAGLIGVGASLGLAAPALAHTDVEVEPAQAGATNALLTVNAESESTTAGITSVQVYLPAGIAPSDVTLVSAPNGWTMAAGTDNYTMSGPALPVGTDSSHQVRIKKLPTDPVIYFKVLQSYSDGRIDRWIDLPTAGVAELERPAPAVTLAGGVAQPSPAATTESPTATPTPSATTAAPTTDPQASTSGGGSGLLIAALVVVGLLVVGAVVYAVIRRRAAD